MDEVWIVRRVSEQDNGGIIGVYSTEEKAEKAVQRKMEERIRWEVLMDVEFVADKFKVQ